MRLQEYGRNPNKRKAYGPQSALLLVGVDVSKAKHKACLATPTTISCRKVAFPHTREGCRRFAQTLRDHLVKNRGQRLLLALEPAGIYWHALYARRTSCGDDVCLVHGQAVRHHRKTMQDGPSKTDATDAYRIFALLLQGQCCVPVARAAALQAAYRWMRRPMAVQKRGHQRRNQLRAAMPLACPEGNPMINERTPPTARRFLQLHPTPESILRPGREPCRAAWEPRPRCGQGRPGQLQQLYDLATQSIGLKDPGQSDAFESKALAHALADARGTQQLWLAQALA